MLSSSPVLRFRPFHGLVAGLLLPCFAVTGPGLCAAQDDTPKPAPAPITPAAAEAPAAAPATSTDAPPADRFTYREASVRAMWIKQVSTDKGENETVGGSSPFTVRVSPNKSDDAAVGLIEHILGGAGDSWKSSAWIAAVAASNTTNRLLTDNEFLVKVHGYIDGPSAGMLMAATMIALMRDEQKSIRPNVTITGTVNPDGTIGPISGLDKKMEGAQKAGIKELGYPMIDDGDPAEFVARTAKLGEQYGVKAVPIRDIYEAYGFLTTRKLGTQRTGTVKPEELNFSPAQSSRLMASSRSLLDETKTRMAGVVDQQNKFTKASAEAKKSFADDRERTQGYLDQAEVFYKQGAAAMAHSRAMMADQSARLAVKEVFWQQAVAKKDGNALRRVYETSLEEVGKLVQALDSSMPNGLEAVSLAGRIAGLNNRLEYWVANSQWLAASSGRSELEAKKVALQNAARAKPRVDDATLQRMSDEIAANMLNTVQRLALLEGQIRAAAELARYPVEDTTVPAPNLATLTKRLAEAYGPAAAAGLAYFESTAVGLRTRGADEEMILHLQARLSTDIAYGACAAAAGHAIRISDDPNEEETPAITLDRLACGAHAYLGMAALMNKYYNLFNESGPKNTKETVNLRKGQTVERMLESSRARVLEEAAEVKKQLPFIPDCIKMSFTLAEAKRSEASDLAKLDALTSYWRAHFLCRMVQMMAKAK